MKLLFPSRRYLAGLLAALLLSAAAGVYAQKTLPLKPDVPGTATNHRLILKDGTYQLVRKYEVVGDRVRYISIERSGEWEELPDPGLIVRYVRRRPVVTSAGSAHRGRR